MRSQTQPVPWASSFPHFNLRSHLLSAIFSSWYLLVGTGEGCVVGAEGKGSFRLQVVTSYQPYSCLSILPGSLVPPAVIFSQPNAELVRQLHLIQLEGCWRADTSGSTLIL